MTDETIRKLRDPVAVHVAMLRGEIAVPPLAELLHVYGATFSDLDAANIEIAKARAEAAKWERLHDELYAEIASEHRRDEYGETETAAECVRRIVRERDELRAAAPELAEALKLWARWGDMTEAELAFAIQATTAALAKAGVK